ncbi:hypothetical protein OIU76_008975 [Salix suchowensis]|nr:hypothetical protein OIU76_008975 [Salix suchowensis]
MNRSCSRENPDILIVMIAEKQIMKCGNLHIASTSVVTFHFVLYSGQHCIPRSCSCWVIAIQQMTGSMLVQSSLGFFSPLLSSDAILVFKIQKGGALVT